VTSATATVGRERARRSARRVLSRHGWTIAVYGLLLVMLLYWRSLSKHWGTFDVQSLSTDALPLVFAAMAQAVVVISGGIDLSVGSLMSVISVLAAKYMIHMSFREAVLFALLLVLVGMLAGAFTGLLITVSRVPNIVVTLAMLFVWHGVALKILPFPGGGAPPQFAQLALGYTLSPWIPTGLVIVLIVFALVWLPIRRAKPGLAIYAIGSNRNATFLSGISVAKTRIGAYALGGAFAALGGLALTAATSGYGDPNAGGYYTLNSVAAIVLGGVALVGGKGGLIGAIAAAVVLTLTKTSLVLRGVDPNYVQVIQGTLIIVVVMLGAFVARHKVRR